MRHLVLAMLITVAACSRPDAAQTNSQGASTDHAAADKPALSGDQRAARAVAKSYLIHVSKGEYDQAHALWDHAGAASGGSVDALKKAYSGYASFRGTVGEVSEISKASGQPRVVVAAAADAVVKSTGAKRVLDGFIYLRDDAHAWRIWGVDLRQRR